MATIDRYTHSQKIGLYTMLKNSINMTSFEKKIYSELRDYFAVRVETSRGAVLVLDGYAKEIEIDTFGEDYRMRWTKLKSTSKGYYYDSSYQGRRIYLD